MKRLGALAAIGVACASAWLAPALYAKDPNHAGLIVRLADGDVRRMCVAFDEPKITGADLLERSGLDIDVDAGSIGTAICKIEGRGCGTGDCFCRYPTFWGYWVRDNDGDRWRFSDVGARERTVRDGTLDGWSWGRDGKPAPPKLSFDDVCPVASGSAEPLASAAPSTARPLAQRARPTSSPSDYLAFAAFVALFAGAAAFAYVVRRRRPGP